MLLKLLVLSSINDSLMYCITCNGLFFKYRLFVLISRPFFLNAGDNRRPSSPAGGAQIAERRQTAAKSQAGKQERDKFGFYSVPATTQPASVASDSHGKK